MESSESPPSALPASIKEKTPSTKEVTVDVWRTMFGRITCIFFGKRGAVHHMKWGTQGHPCGSVYDIDDFENSTLMADLEAVERAVGVSVEGSLLYRLAPGLYVHNYMVLAQFAAAI